MLRRFVLLPGTLTAMLLLATASSALGHTKMEETIPADGAVLDVSPPQVVVVFNAAIQQERSSVVVLDAGGATVSEGGLDPADPTRLVADLPPLENGRYLVRYTAYSADNELLRDQLEFEVAVAAISATPAPTPTPAPSPTTEPSAAPTPTVEPLSPEPAPAVTPASSTPPDGDTPGGADAVQVLIPLVVGGVIIAAVVFFLIRRRQA